MEELVKALSNIDEQYGYEISKKGNLYLAGAKKITLKNGIIKGDLFLDALKRWKKTFWAPLLCNPDNTEKMRKEKRKNQILIHNLTLADYGWLRNSRKPLDFFVEKIEIALLNKMQRMNEKDIVYFFEGIHKHYMSYLYL